MILRPNSYLGGGADQCVNLVSLAVVVPYAGFLLETQSVSHRLWPCSRSSSRWVVEACMCCVWSEQIVARSVWQEPGRSLACY